MGMEMRMIKGMVSAWYRARQKPRLIKDTDSKIQNKIAFFCSLAPSSLFRTPGPRQFLSLSQFLLLNQTERSLSGNFIDRKDKQQGVLPLWVPMSDARFADSKITIHKVNRCLARYSPRATTTNRPINRALNKPAWPSPYQPKIPILGQIWSFLGKKS